MERYVPANKNSILVDVPGYYGKQYQQQNQTTLSSTTTVEDSKNNSSNHRTNNNNGVENSDAAVVVGPICWKCHGNGYTNSSKQKKNTKKKNNNDKYNAEKSILIVQDKDNKDNNNNNNNNNNNENDDDKERKNNNVICPVCNGSKHIQCRKLTDNLNSCNSNSNSNSNSYKNKQVVGGIITRGRQYISSYKFKGPKPYGYTILYWGTIVQRATYQCQDEIITTTIPSTTTTTTTIKGSTAATETTSTTTTTTSTSMDDNDTDFETKLNTTTTSDLISVVVQQQQEQQVIVSEQHDLKIQVQVLPDWLPQSTNNEQLCNLVGEWRILQKIKSHRWTTDDLVTAYVACKVIEDKILLSKQEQLHSNQTTATKSTGMNYLDLGTGNGSVLQMVVWSSIQQQQQQLQNSRQQDHDTTLPLIIESATGVEARYEAVQLARRSIQFNLNTTTSTSTTTNSSKTPKVQIVHSDFRTYFSTTCNNNTNCSTTTTTNTDTTAYTNTKNDNTNNNYNQNTMLYDLITGTPPYFRVDFEVTSSSNNDDDNTNNKNNSNNKKKNNNSNNYNNKVKIYANSKNSSSITIDDPKQQQQQQHSDTYTKRIKVDCQQQQQQQQQQQELVHCDVQNEDTNESQRNQSIDCAKSTTFNANESDNTTTTKSNSIVQTAIIRQGGMPTSIQSAPARCEFRGGIEDYCSIASNVLKINTGRFIVCINYLNHTRALHTFLFYNLFLHKIYYIHGKTTRPILFCVYVLSKQQQKQQVDLRDDKQQHQQQDKQYPQQPCYDGAIANNDAKNNNKSYNNLPSTSCNESLVEEFHIAVRDHNGDLTTEYKETVLQFMGIPYV